MFASLICSFHRLTARGSDNGQMESDRAKERRRRRTKESDTSGGKKREREIVVSFISPENNEGGDGLWMLNTLKPFPLTS